MTRLLAEGPAVVLSQNVVVREEWI